MASVDAAVDLNISNDLELGLQQPRRSHQSHHYPYRVRAHHHEQSQRLEASTTPERPTVTAEQLTEARI